MQTTLGAADGARTVVEVYDFNCGYCRKALGINGTPGCVIGDSVVPRH